MPWSDFPSNADGRDRLVDGLWVIDLKRRKINVIWIWQFFFTSQYYNLGESDRKDFIPSQNYWGNHWSHTSSAQSSGVVLQPTRDGFFMFLQREALQQFVWVNLTSNYQENPVPSKRVSSGFHGMLSFGPHASGILKSSLRKALGRGLSALVDNLHDQQRWVANQRDNLGQHEDYGLVSIEKVGNWNISNLQSSPVQWQSMILGMLESQTWTIQSKQWVSAWILWTCRSMSK